MRSWLFAIALFLTGVVSEQRLSSYKLADTNIQTSPLLLNDTPWKLDFDGVNGNDLPFLTLDLKTSALVSSAEIQVKSCAGLEKVVLTFSTNPNGPYRNGKEMNCTKDTKKAFNNEINTYARYVQIVFHQLASGGYSDDTLLIKKIILMTKFASVELFTEVLSDEVSRKQPSGDIERLVTLTKPTTVRMVRFELAKGTKLPSAIIKFIGRKETTAYAFRRNQNSLIVTFSKETEIHVIIIGTEELADSKITFFQNKKLLEKGGFFPITFKNEYYDLGKSLEIRQIQLFENKSAKYVPIPDTSVEHIFKLEMKASMVDAPFHAFYHTFKADPLPAFFTARFIKLQTNDFNNPIFAQIYVVSKAGCSFDGAGYGVNFIKDRFNDGEAVRYTCQYQQIRKVDTAYCKADSNEIIEHGGANANKPVSIADLCGI